MLLSDLSEDSGAKTKLCAPHDELKSGGFPPIPPIGNNIQARQCTENLSRTVLTVVCY